MANYGPPGDDLPDLRGGRRPDDGYNSAGVDTEHTPPAVPRSRPIGPEDYPNPDGADPYRPDGPGPVSYDGKPVPRPGRGPLYVLLAVLAVALVAGATTLVWLLGRAGSDPVESTPTGAAAGGPTAPASAAVSVGPTAPAPDASADPRFVKEGQCVRNDGPAGGKPKLLIADCAPRTYEVLRRFDGATSGEKDAEAKCATVDGYTNWFFFDSELDTLDFVLCLKQR